MYGGRIVLTTVLPVRIIRSPTCSSWLFAGRYAREPSLPMFSARAAIYPPIGARGFVPQKIWVPTIPTRWTITVFNTIDFAVAAPTPTGPPPAV